MEDAEIVDLYWQRDQQAIAETDKKYGAYFRGLALSVLGNEQDSEECVSDAYMKLWETIPPQKPAKLGAFTARIVRNIALNTLTRLSALKRGGGEGSTPFDEIAQCLPSAESTERTVESRELARVIERFLGTLGREKQLIFMKRYWYFESVSDIAREMDISESKVKMSLKRTRDRLREFLGKEGVEI